jgi:hypothetical protein
VRPARGASTPLDVGEVDAHRFDDDRDLAATRFRRVQVDEFEDVRAAVFGGADGTHVVVGRTGRRKRFGVDGRLAAGVTR